MLARKPLDQRSFARLVFALDERLRRRYGVFDYVRHADCIFRVRIDAVNEAMSLPDGVWLHPGDRIIELHFRNEHLPKMNEKGATIGWAIRAAKLFDISLRELALFLGGHDEFDDIAGVRAIMLLRGAKQIEQFERIVTRVGFQLAPNPARRGLKQWARGLGENVFTFFLVLAANPRAARAGVLWGRWASAFLSRQALEARYRERSIQLNPGNYL